MMSAKAVNTQEPRAARPGALWVLRVVQEKEGDAGFGQAAQTVNPDSAIEMPMVRDDRKVAAV